MLFKERGIKHSVSRAILVQLCEWFIADIGLDKGAGVSGSVRFHVRAGEKTFFDTPTTRSKDGVRSIDVPLHGAKSFESIVGERR